MFFSIRKHRANPDNRYFSRMKILQKAKQPQKQRPLKTCTHPVATFADYLI